MKKLLGYITIFFTAHPNSNTKFSSEVFYLYRDSIKFTVEKVGLLK